MPQQSTEQSKMKYGEDLERFHAICDLIQQEAGYQGVCKFILDMMQCGNLTIEDFEQLSTEQDRTKWDYEKVALSFGLYPALHRSQFQRFSTPHAYLPPSFHKRVMKDSIQWLDVYQEDGTQNRDAAISRLMDAWHVPTCALFKGRVVDAKPENTIPESSETSGIEVEHEVYMLHGIILLVVQLKLAFKSERDHIAQVLLDLVSAYKTNNDDDFEPQPPVYAVLYDLKDFYFFSYDGSSFKTGENIRVSSETRVQFFNGMAEVAEHLFSTILQGYITTLNAVIKRSKTHGIMDDNNYTPVTFNDWTKATSKAEEAQTILMESDRSSLKVWEDAGQRGLRCLKESVSYFENVGSVTDWDEQQIEYAIDRVLSSRCKQRDEK